MLVTAGGPYYAPLAELEFARACRAPVRANLIAAGFVDTPPSASLRGDHLDRRRERLRATLAMGRDLGPPTPLRSPCTS